MKTAQPILMAKIYVIEGIKEVLKKIWEPIPLIRRRWKKLSKFLNNCFNINYFLKTHHFFPISCSHSKLQYIFFRKLSERYFIVKNNKIFFGPYNVWKIRCLVQRYSRERQDVGHGHKPREENTYMGKNIYWILWLKKKIVDRWTKCIGIKQGDHVKKWCIAFLNW